MSAFLHKNLNSEYEQVGRLLHCISSISGLVHLLWLSDTHFHFSKLVVLVSYNINHRKSRKKALVKAAKPVHWHSKKVGIDAARAWTWTSHCGNSLSLKRDENLFSRLLFGKMLSKSHFARIISRHRRVELAQKYLAPHHYSKATFQLHDQNHAFIGKTSFWKLQWRHFFKEN